MSEVMKVEYQVWFWEDEGIVLYLETEDYGKVVNECKHLRERGLEPLVYKKTTEILHI